MLNEKGLIELRAKLDTFLLRKELDKFTQHLFVIKKKKCSHRLMLSPLKTRYSSVMKDKISELVHQNLQNLIYVYLIQTFREGR